MIQKLSNFDFLLVKITGKSRNIMFAQILPMQELFEQDSEILDNFRG